VDRLRLLISALRADAIVVTHPPNVLYLCGFSGTAGVLLVETNDATLFTDSRYTIQARSEVSGSRIEISKEGLLRAVGEKLRTRKGRSWVAYSPASVTVEQKEKLQIMSGTRVRWVKSENEVEKLRSVKDAEELARMQAATALGDEVHRTIVPIIKSGMTELELSAEIEYRMKRLGASGPSFETIVAAGPRSAWPHARPSSKPLNKNELVVIDHGVILRDYCSDMTRTFFLGRSTAKVRRLYRAVLEAQEAAKGAIRPGARAEEVDSVARAVLRKHGLARYFTHSLGHGLGLEVHEMPRLGRGETTILQEGMVLTVEPGVYLEGFGGIRIEDEVAVTSTGAKYLTTAPRGLLDL
jgi:Xaa-Pro aminopeptidase